jgi:hypothetical protein
LNGVSLLKQLRREYRVVTDDQHKYFSYKLTKDEEYSLQLQAALFIDEQCFLFNKKRVNEWLNDALLERNEERFIELRKTYSHYIDG